MQQSQVSLFPVNSFSKHTAAPSPLILPLPHPVFLQPCQSLQTSRGPRAGSWRSRRQPGAACRASGSTRTATRPCSATSWPTPTAASPTMTSSTCWSSARYVTRRTQRNLGKWLQPLCWVKLFLHQQGSRLDDQRCAPPTAPPVRGPTVPDEDFFSLIMRSQAKRMDEQRVTLPSASNPAARTDSQ